jgi:AcrR family transcriptional regulator
VYFVVVDDAARRESVELNRFERRRLATRAKLLDAGFEVLGSQSHATVKDITDQADVGLGTFYNHFDSREELLSSLEEEVRRRVVEPVENATQHLDDPADLMACRLRLMLIRLRDETAVGRFVASVENSGELLRRVTAPRTARILAAGVAAERFTVHEPLASMAVIGGGFRAHLRLSQSLGLDDANDVAFVATILQSLGLGSVEALDLASRPLPPLT